MRNWIVALIVSYSVISVAAPLTPEQREQARQHYDSASRKFDVGRFDDAATEFQAVYELTGDPSLLFNIAQSFRQAQKYDKALLFYRSYLNKLPDAGNRLAVEKRIGEINEILEKQKSVSEAPPQGTIKPPAEDKPSQESVPPNRETPAAPVEPPRPPPPALRYTGIALGGLAVAALGAGIAMSVLASNASNDLHRAAKAGSTVFSPDLQTKESNGRTYDTVAIAAYVVAGVAAAASGVTLYLGYRKPRERRVAVVPVIAPGLAGVAVGGAF